MKKQNELLEQLFDESKIPVKKVSLSSSKNTSNSAVVTSKNTIKEIKRPDINAQLVAENIAASLERRISFRRAMKQAIQRTMRAGAKGIKTSVSGRLGGADMARTEGYSEGTIPLQTIRADIDYGFAEADTTYGKLGVKVWIYKGEVLPGMKEAELPEVKSKKRNYKKNNARKNRQQTRSEDK